MSANDVLSLIFGPIILVCGVMGIWVLVKLNIAISEWKKDAITVTDMTDEDFLDYCSLHCGTERALFNYEQVLRLHQLARVKEVPQSPGGGWMSMGPKMVDPLVERARRFSKFQVLDGGKKPG